MTEWTAKWRLMAKKPVLIYITIAQPACVILVQHTFLVYLFYFPLSQPLQLDPNTENLSFIVLSYHFNQLTSSHKWFTVLIVKPKSWVFFQELKTHQPLPTQIQATADTRYRKWTNVRLKVFTAYKTIITLDMPKCYSRFPSKNDTRFSVFLPWHSWWWWGD